MRRSTGTRRAAVILAALLTLAAGGTGAAPPPVMYGDDAYLVGSWAYAREDYGTAMTSWKRAANNGNPLTAQYVGRLYERGEGVRRQPREAARWYERAVAGGNHQAALDLARLYLTGEAGRRDPERARTLLAQAASNGDPAAQAAVERMVRGERENLAAVLREATARIGPFGQRGPAITRPKPVPRVTRPAPQPAQDQRTAPQPAPASVARAQPATPAPPPRANAASGRQQEAMAAMATGTPSRKSVQARMPGDTPPAKQQRKTSTGPRLKVSVASYRRMDSARAGWKEVLAAVPAFGRLEHKIEARTLKGRKWLRLYVWGPRTAVMNACRQWDRKGGDCLRENGVPYRF